MTKDDINFNFLWIATLFGTAIGAGILFLPIQAGSGGVVAFLCACVIMFPAIWLAHSNLARFIIGQNSGDITQAFESAWGTKIGFLLTFLWFFDLYPAVLIYGIGLINTLIDFLIYQLKIQSILQEQNTLPPFIRAVFCFGVISFLMIIISFKEKIILSICSALVYPLCAALFIFSIYFIPHWKLSALFTIPSNIDFIWAILMIFLVLIFATDHSAPISTFALSCLQNYKQNAEKKCRQTTLYTAIMLFIFIAFFTCSCMLCLEPNDFIRAKEQNISILSYFANSLNEPFIAYAAPIIAFLAILSSFLGFYFGTLIGVKGVIRHLLKSIKLPQPNEILLDRFCNAFMFITLIIVSFLNPSILGIIEIINAPIIAAFTFIIPIIGFYSVPSLRHLRRPILDIFTAILGTLVILGILFF